VEEAELEEDVVEGKDDVEIELEVVDTEEDAELEEVEDARELDEEVELVGGCEVEVLIEEAGGVVFEVARYAPATATMRITTITATTAVVRPIASLHRFGFKLCCCGIVGYLDRSITKTPES